MHKNFIPFTWQQKLPLLQLKLSHPSFVEECDIVDFFIFSNYCKKSSYVIFLCWYPIAICCGWTYGFKGWLNLLRNAVILSEEQRKWSILI